MRGKIRRKIEILYYLVFHNVRRFGEFKRHIRSIIPPRVEYSLTPLGESFIPVMQHLKAWGDEHMDEFVINTEDFNDKNN